MSNSKIKVEETLEVGGKQDNGEPNEEQLLRYAMIALEENQAKLAEMLLTRAHVSYQSELAKIYLDALKENPQYSKLPLSDKQHSKVPLQDIQRKIYAKILHNIAKYLTEREAYALAKSILMMSFTFNNQVQVNENSKQLMIEIDAYMQHSPQAKKHTWLTLVMNHAWKTIENRNADNFYSYVPTTTEDAFKYKELNAAAILENQPKRVEKYRAIMKIFSK